MNREEFPALGERNRRGRSDARGRSAPRPLPTPLKTDWEKETRQLDRQLTVRIEKLLEQRKRLRETVEDVANRPPLAGKTQGERSSGPLPSLRPPPADYIDGPGGKRRKKKKKKAGGEAIPGGSSALASSSSVGPVKGLRVVEDATLRGRDIIPISRFQPKESWVEVVGRRARRTAATDTRPLHPPPMGGRGAEVPRARAGGRMTAVKPQKPPNSSAVTLTCPPGTYEEAMRTAKASIKPEDLEITRMRFKRAVTGALTMEIPGDKEGRKAAALAERLAALFADKEEIRVARPIKTAEIRIKNLDDSVTAGEVALAVAEFGGCSAANVRTGAVSRAPNGLGTIWVKCPLTAANKVAAVGRIRVGQVPGRSCWTCAPFSATDVWRGGHVRQNCPSKTDRSGLCYRCGAVGHRASECSQPPSCPLCRHMGLPANHRAGSRACAPARWRRRGGLVPRAPPPVEATAAPAATKRNGDVGTPKEEEAATSRGESPKSQRTKKRRTDLSPSNTGEMEEMELEGSADHTQ